MFDRSWSESLRRLALLALLLPVLVLAACDDDDDPIVDDGPTEELPTVTVTVTGSFGQNATSTHDFTAIASGFARMTVTELGPVETVTIGLGLGQRDDEGNCVLLASDRSVTILDSFLSQGTVAESAYCVSVFDVGNLFPGNVVEYTMTIEHT
ncbi:MAG: hypothetical protein AAGA81_13975 [Acidobacteriota bacterium]